MPSAIVPRLGGFLLLIIAMSLARAADGPVRFPHPDRIKYDSACFQIEGRDTFLYGGSFHYFRVPRELWRDRFLKMKEAGCNVVETYVPWNYHERQAPSGPDDFSKIDLSELDAWISMAQQFGFYVIIRPGPYICAEWSGGGYPQWLVPLFKPVDWPKGKVWLQTDDPTYLAWTKHWYDAVARVIVPHQITRLPPGSPGVIMVQIENEYERVKWVPDDAKTRYLAALARQARDAGIDVPLVTCWTRQSRNSENPDLAGVFDFINSYPKWSVGKKMADIVAQQRKEQPYAPIGAMELQGGWYSAIGGQLSENLDGLAPVQTQNLALYCLQLGYSCINYYMMVGGTNFDDWASREVTTTYDFYAPIRENGGVGDKYLRVAAIGAFLQEHGASLLRSKLVPVETSVADPDVEIALRQAADGTRYVFVRTTDRKLPHSGHARVTPSEGAPFSFDFTLEPFGSKILVLSPKMADAAKGQWFPRLSPEPTRPPAADLPVAIDLTRSGRMTDPLPTSWNLLSPGISLESRGIVDHHFLYYRIPSSAGSELTVNRLGGNVVARTLPDGILAWADGHFLPVKSSGPDVIVFAKPAIGPVTLLYENAGLHHHTNLTLEHEWPLGIRGVYSAGGRLPLEYASVERQRGIAGSLLEAAGPSWVSVRVGPDAPAAPEALLTWQRFEFELPAPRPGVWVPWHFHLEAMGNGFIYLNGHCIGRTWEIGPQRDFFLPECWLRFGPGSKNVILVSLRPLDKGVRVTAAAVVPDYKFAEFRH